MLVCENQNQNVMNQLIFFKDKLRDLNDLPNRSQTGFACVQKIVIGWLTSIFIIRVLIISILLFIICLRNLTILWFYYKLIIFEKHGWKHFNQTISIRQQVRLKFGKHILQTFYHWYFNFKQGGINLKDIFQMWRCEVYYHIESQ